MMYDVDCFFVCFWGWDLLLLLFGLFADRNCRLHLWRDVGQFRFHDVEVGIDLRLIRFVNFREREQGDPCKNDEGDAIEPGAQISAAPQQNGELDRVNQILDQEKTTQLYERGIHVGNGNFRHLLDLLLRNDNVEFQIFLEWMSITSLLDSLHNILVDAEGNGGEEAKQRDVCANADQREELQAEKDDQHRAKDWARFFRVPPVDEALHSWI